MKIKILIGLSLSFCSLSAQTPFAVQAFKSQEVQLLSSDFSKAQATDLKYMMALEPDRLLAPYLREAGLTPKATNYKNWESDGLDGHIGGHYLTALSLMYASTGDVKVKERLNYMLQELKKCQDKNGDGYLGGVPGSKVFWAKIFNGEVEKVSEKWVPFYNIHKTFAGLRDAWLYTQNKQAKAMLLKFANWHVALSSKLTDKQMETLLRTEYGGVNEVLADVAAITGDKKYLLAAQKFSQKAILNPLIKHEDKLDNLHANTQIPKIIGFKRIAEIDGNEDYNQAARFFWETVTQRRSVAIGGNSVREHFNPANNFSSMISSEQGPETCNTYNMLKLTKMLYQSEGLVNYIDYYERALYNHILSTQQPETGGFVYFTPMRPGHYRVYSQPETSMWCCVGSGIENHAKYNELIYAHTAKNLYVNLFIPSVLNWNEKGLTLTQQTKFPEEEVTLLKINIKKPATFSLNIRYPKWVDTGLMKIKVNKREVKFSAKPGSYAAITQTWKNGDEVEVTLPMKTTTEQLPDGSNYVAVLHGPIVLAAKTDTTNMKDLYADDSRFGHVANDKQYPLLGMPIFVSEQQNLAKYIKPVAGKPLTFSASKIIYPAQYKSLELIPFYKLHNSRYVIYWQTENENQLKARQEKLAIEEEALAKLDAQTIDLVYPGEQQPESDHFMKSEKSESGVNNGKHWRDAKAWFSYQLADAKKEAKKLQITYYGRDTKRLFNILINGEIIVSENFKSSKGDKFYTQDYEIPAALLENAKGVLVVKFEALQGSATAGIYEVRLIR
ncbi:glycoside hydrolase family 127 protein [Pedobacter cryophilus]|uniref:Glycosyl hydrolase n=1 Tax=Pedobacter cryophilus TaxID=2571271 RepID=A0A4U1BXZ2_9SPHI|nr:glycoside hydrolase family 127 protein [Pedobacter cryophilus]TKB96259.1 glycosyl hydrolase [Pedobacter cryophilus]